MSAPHSNPYRDYAIEYAHHANCKPEHHGGLLAYHASQPHDKPPEIPFTAAGPQHPGFEHSPHASASNVLPGTAPPTMVHGISQPMLLPQQQHHMLHRHMAPQYPPPGSLGLLSPHRGQKRSLEGTESDHDDGGRSAIRRHLPGFPSVEGTADAAANAPDFLFPPHPEHPSVTHHEFDPQASGAAMGVPPQHQQHHHHHHHRLPPHAPLPTTGHPHDVNAHSQSYMTGPPSVVGQPGMPKPAPRPKGPKLKFSPVEDTTLVHLKEEKNLTWKQIADFFPGRTSGTLQVRYCTKLKAKDVIWTDDMVFFPLCLPPVQNDSHYPEYD